MRPYSSVGLDSPISEPATQRLVRNLRAAGALRTEVTEQRALVLLMVLTSYETFRELRLDGRTEAELVAELQDTAASLLLP